MRELRGRYVEITTPASKMLEDQGLVCLKLKHAFILSPDRVETLGRVLRLLGYEQEVVEIETWLWRKKAVPKGSDPIPAGECDHDRKPGLFCSRCCLCGECAETRASEQQAEQSAEDAATATGMYDPEG